MSETTTPTNWGISAELRGQQRSLSIQAGTYPGKGRPALLMWNEDDELFCEITINAPHILLWDDSTQLILHPDLRRDVITLLEESGLIEDVPAMDVKLGMATTWVYDLTEDGAAWFLNNSTHTEN